MLWILTVDYWLKTVNDNSEPSTVYQIYFIVPATAYNAETL